MGTARLNPDGPGERVFLRAPRASDCHEFLRLNRASRRLHRGLASPPVTRGQFALYLRRLRRVGNRGFVICRIADGAIIGGINVSEIVRGSLQSAYLGYQIGEPFARQGYMSEALPLALSFAFGRLGLHRVEANIQPGNRASIALVRRAGFRREGLSQRYLKVGGRWRDHERWTLLAEEWRARRARGKTQRTR
ncbi:MAG: RimJ/RimL family protein N-acetyltransferase [Candidatus Rokuibacteriota bacterium]|nr:MAG: RimJ/RimL family protein N-acetyltransferase [Candidatus Rokubacteria bacterium]